MGLGMCDYLRLFPPMGNFRKNKFNLINICKTQSGKRFQWHGILEYKVKMLKIKFCGISTYPSTSLMAMTGLAHDGQNHKFPNLGG